MKFTKKYTVKTNEKSTLKHQNRKRFYRPCPTFEHGDLLIIKNLTNPKLVRWGNPYVMISKEEKLVKRVFEDKTKEYFILKSDNGDYEEQKLKKELIKYIWEIKGIIRKF